MREKYESLSLVVLRDLAKARGLKNISSMKKSDLVNRMLEEDARKQKETERKYWFPMASFMQTRFVIRLKKQWRVRCQLYLVECYPTA